MRLQRGFTFIELLVVLALLGGILGMTAVAQTDTITRSHVREERDLFVSLILASARTRALANVDESSHGVHIDNDNQRYILFNGDTYNPDDTTNRSVPFVNDTTEITHTHGDETILFEALRGNILSGSGTYTIDSNGAVLTVSVNDIGQIDW